MENKVLQRLRKFIKYNGLTIKSFAESIDTSEGTFKTMFNRETNPSVELLLKISNVYQDLSLRWLLKGEGDMCITTSDDKEDEVPRNYAEVEEYKSASEPLREYLPITNFLLVPLVNMDVVGGLNNEEMDVAQYVEKYIPFTDAKKEDIACPVTNNSMFPIYPPGSIVQIRKIEMWKEYIEYGQVYVVDLVDGRRLIKEIRKSKVKGNFLLHSYNNGYDDNDIPINMIYSMWLVIAKYEKVVM